MNFLCDKCKQKYHVADEKLAGRAVTARYDPRQLEAAQRVVRSLEEGARRSGSHAEKKLKTRSAKPTKPAKPKE